MSTQLEFIMQLYMMNLMQQQQQQQQQQQAQTSPAKTKDILTSPSYPQEELLSSIGAKAATTTSTITTTATKPRTLKRKNSQTINCSSSSSSSPNSNSSQTSNTLSSSLLPSQAVTPQVAPFQQLLLSNLLAQQQQLQQVPSNLLLTPTTPSSLGAAKALDYLSGTLLPHSLLSSPTTTATAFPISPSLMHCTSAYPTNNFLQSSTVTSTPCYEKTTFARAEEEISSVGADEEREQDGDDEDSAAPQSHVDCILGDEDDDTDNNKPMSSVYSSSGVASSSGASASDMKLLSCSGLQPLESTTDSCDFSDHMPYTPIKQPADSSFSPPQPMSLRKETRSSRVTSSQSPSRGAGDEICVATPVTGMGNAMLTPPSSEQLAPTTFETCQTAGTPFPTGTLASASSLDSFLANEENLKNLRKFTSYLECENVLCRQENLREHFHCFDEPCQGKILSKKDDIIRHLKWHKKRKESLLLGFARFSSSDDCAPAYGEGCAYNWKQTHYHCVYEECPKVYVSTSDVQMHANFHRKNSEIVQEGFRRFRAHENCKIEDCPFYGKKISHYHCCREGCNHTFKNKADMDKHKTYHMKDHQLTQDGFKKILKTEVCPFESCKFSTVCNHIHCVRENCNYILHSSTQMISHKRKHERQDGEQTYQNFKVEKASSEDESPKPVVAQPSSNSVSTPLSSLSAEHFLSRKRGRPPKKIQLPAEMSEAKRLKTEASAEQQAASFLNPSQMPAMFPPFLPNFNPAAAAAAAASQSQDPTAPNFQLTHLMALFQLQNPLFYQNLYPGGMTAANMASMLGAAAAAANGMPTANILGNLPMFPPSNTSAAGNPGSVTVKSEFNDKSQYKE